MATIEIISTDQGHVIRTDNKARPFRIRGENRMLAFTTLAAAKKALKAKMDKHCAEVSAMRKDGVSC